MLFKFKIFLGFASICLISIFAVNAADSHINDKIQNGKNLYQEVLKIDPKNKPMVRGQMASVPIVSLFIPKTIWENLTKEDQIDYTYYVESLIPKIKLNPEKYVLIPKSAPLYNKFLRKTSNLCTDCWSIIIGEFTQRNGEVYLSADQTVVQGDRPWNSNEPCCRGIKSSDFRQ